MAGIDIAAVTKEVEVDNNLPVKIYLRTARLLLRGAEVYRNEGNKLQLYILLLRYVSLVLRTIPRHEDAKNPVFSGERQYLKQQAVHAMDELEALKPQVELLNRLGNLRLEEPFPEEEDGVVPSYLPTSPSFVTAPAASSSASYFAPLYASTSTPGSAAVSGSMDLLEDWAKSIGAPASQQQMSYSQALASTASSFLSMPATSYSMPLAISGLSLNSSLPEPSAEALSRHSFFSFASSSSAAQPRAISSGPFQVTYPSLDASPVTMPDLLGSRQQPATAPAVPATSPPAALTQTAGTAAEAAAPAQASTHPFGGQAQATASANEMISVLLPSAHPTQQHLPPGAAAAVAASLPQGAPPAAVAAATAAAAAAAMPAPRVQPTPPPVLAQVHSLPRDSSQQAQPARQTPDPPPTKVGAGTISKPGGVKAVHISPKMMDEFMRMVHNNTRRNLETCGILAGNLKKGVFFITTLILPKQQATSDSCSTLNEEEIFEVQDKRGLFQVGWIHTHPSQACFMSSIDLHTHYSYQVMLPEAIAIVMAPTDSSRKSGIFRLSDPGGLKVIQNCRLRGFHAHDPPPDGSPIYLHSSHVFYNPKVKFDVVDIRAT